MSANPIRLDLEQRALAGALHGTTEAAELIESIAPDEWALAEHRQLAVALATMVEADHAVSAESVADFLVATGQRVAPDVLATITARDPGQFYTQILDRLTARIQLERMRLELRDLSAAIRAAAEDENEVGALAAIDASLDRLLDARDRAEADQAQSFSPEELAEVYTEELAVAVELAGDLPGLPSSIPSLDQILGGLVGGRMIVLAGRPGMGKTAFLAQVAAHLGQTGHRSSIVSAEMSTAELMARMAPAFGGPSAGRLRGVGAGGPSDLARNAAAAAAAAVRNSGLHIIDANGATTSTLRRTVRRAVRSHHVDVVMVDYLQLIHADVPGRNREREVAVVSQTCKELARRYDIPLLVAAQLNRSAEQRGGDRPTLADLRESGAIEQDADQVIFLHRTGELATELVVAKNRHGPTGVVPTHWAPGECAFTDAREMPPAPPLPPPSSPSSIRVLGARRDEF